MSTRLSPSFAALALVAVLTPVARAQSSDGEAELAAAKFLVEQKGLATGKAPAEQWYAVYAGPCWTSAGSIVVTEKDKDEGGLRRVDLLKITTRERENPAREHESWWIDASGSVVRGERRVFEEHGDKPKESARYEFKGGKIKITYTVHDEEGGPKTEVSESDLPPAFVPDHLLVVVMLPASDKGKTWKFSTFGGEDSLPFTVTDQGAEKVKGRSGEVEAHKLVVKDKEGEVAYWLDADRRIVSQKWTILPNVQGVAGSPEESRQDWLSRPADEADAAADKALAGPAALEKLAGELSYGIYDKKGHARQVFTGTLKKEEGKFRYLGTVAEVDTASTTTEDWSIAADGTPVAGSIVRDHGGEKKTTTAKVDGKKIVVHSSDAEEGEKDATVPLLPRLIAPDALYVIRALAKTDLAAGAGLRFSGLDISGELPFSLWIELKGNEKVRLRGGEADCKHFHILQNTAEAHCWIDANGNFVVQWSDGDQNVSGTPEECKKDLGSRVGPPKKASAGDDE